MKKKSSKKVTFQDIFESIPAPIPDNMYDWTPHEKQRIVRFFMSAPRITAKEILYKMDLDPLDWHPTELSQMTRKFRKWQRDMITFETIYNAVPMAEPIDAWDDEEREDVLDVLKNASNVSSDDILEAMGLHPDDWTKTQRATFTTKLRTWQQMMNQ